MNPLDNVVKNIVIFSETISEEENSEEKKLENSENLFLKDQKIQLLKNIHDIQTDINFSYVTERTINSLKQLQDLSLETEKKNLRRRNLESILEEKEYKLDMMNTANFIVTAKEAFDEVTHGIVRAVCHSQPKVEAQCQKIEKKLDASIQDIFQNIPSTLQNAINTVMNEYNHKIQREIEKNLALGISAELTTRYYQDLPKLALLTVPKGVNSKIPNLRIDKKIKKSGKGQITTKRPALSSEKIISIAESLGYHKVPNAGKGAHTKLKKDGLPTLIVPSNKELGKGITIKLWKQLEEAIKNTPWQDS